MKKLYTLLAIMLLGLHHGVFADTTLEQKLERSFNKYVTKLGSANSTKQITTLEKLSDTIDHVLETKKLSSDKRGLIEFLAKINNDALLNAIIKQENSAFKTIYDTHSTSITFDRKILNNTDIFLEDGVWYFYRYNTWASFPNTNYTTRDLAANNLTSTTTLLDIRDGKIVFINDFEKIRLIEDNIISGVRDKYSFLKEIKDDKRFLSSNTDEYFKQLRADTDILIGDEKDTKKKIEKIYDFVLSSVSYPEELDLEDRKIFSGILTYKNNGGVCEGYSKLMVYMLGFAGIGDYEAIRGYVIDAPDFPDIGHAWVRVGDRYYDPTFDDPIGLKQTRTPDKYIYYDMPKDLFYTNRYHYDELPEFLKTRTVEFRDNYIEKRLASLVDDYEGGDYIILKPFEFKKELGIDYNDDITIDNLKYIMTYYEVINGKLTQNGKNISIGTTSFSYYKVSDDSIPTALKQINYEIDNFFLIKLEDESYGIGYQ